MTNKSIHDNLLSNMNSQQYIEKSDNVSNLQEAIDFIAAKFVFDEASYPLLQKLSPEEKLQFSVNHSLQHMAKSLGKIATHLEDVDHGGKGNMNLLKEGLVKQLINVLRLAELLDISGDDLLKEVPKFMS
jgi:hypothetical protein